MWQKHRRNGVIIWRQAFTQQAEETADSAKLSRVKVASEDINDSIRLITHPLRVKRTPQEEKEEKIKMDWKG